MPEGIQKTFAGGNLSVEKIIERQETTVRMQGKTRQMDRCFFFYYTKAFENGIIK